jgi:hypothetical protein
MKRILVLGIAALMAVASVAVAGNGDGNQGGDNNSNCGSLQSVVAELPFEDVSGAEEADLLLMREEEKLARDVYQAMDDMWGLRVFGQIMWSEQKHMDAILAVLDKYGIPDPVGDNPPGTFTDPALQDLFSELLALGSQSLIDALYVGATIEDLDIFDLDEALDRADNLDIRTVYQNLQKGSRNHLRSFTDLLLANDVTYEPQYLSPEDYEAIVSTPHEQGMLDADGEPVECGGDGDGDGPGPGPGGNNRHRNRHAHQNGSQSDEPLQMN